MCGYIETAEGATCSHVHDASCGGLTVDGGTAPGAQGPPAADSRPASLSRPAPAGRNGGVTYDGLTITVTNGDEVTKDADGLIKLGNGTYTISGTWGGTLNGTAYDNQKAVITVPADKTANVTLSDVTIDVKSTGYACAFAVETNATANITISGTNTLKSGKYRAGLEVPENAAATIGGAGVLNATGGSSGAGIGGGSACSDGTFAPGRPITRGEFAAIAARFDSEPYSGPDLFLDIAGHWAAGEINRAGERGWVRGTPDGSYRPDDLITRAEAAALINRVLERAPETAADLLPGMKTFPDNLDVSKWYYLDLQEAANGHSYDRKTDGVHETWTALD